MFKVTIGRRVLISGCPERGIEALDFRRAHGLPDATDNFVDLDIRITNEEVARHYHSLGFCDDGGDVNWYGKSWPIVLDYRDGQTEPRTSEYNTGDLTVAAELAVRLLKVEPAAICELANLRVAQKGEQAKAWEAQREAYLAVERVKAAKVRRLEEARSLLADELSDMVATANGLGKRLDVVCRFLSNVPSDAIRGTAKAIAAERAGKTAVEVLAEAEEASMFVLIGDETEDD